MARSNQEGRTTRPGPFAAAMKYVRGEHAAPRVTAAGRGTLAMKILEAARRYGVPIHEDPDLAAALATLKINQEIPPALYRVVAAILVFVYRMNNLAREREKTG